MAGGRAIFHPLSDLMKSELIFALEHAMWPALLIERSGIVRKANQAAVAAFGAVMEENFTQLSAIWSPENELKADPFLARADLAPTPTQPLKFRVRGGVTTVFSTCIAPLTREQEKFFLFQLFPMAAPVQPPEAEARAEALEATQIQKQKLECALQLTRTVALDFNNALTSILGHTSLILSKLEGNSPWRGSLLEVEKSASKAAEITHDLATFSQQEKRPAARAAGNLNELLRRTNEVFKASAPAHLSWKLHLESRLYSVNFDEAKMQQAFVKILENCAQAVGEDGRITILTRNRNLAEPSHDGSVVLPAGCYVCVEFTDNGCGMAADVLPRIFEPFFTTKKGHRGLGLAWVYGIVTNHGGMISVTSEPGQGTIVRLYLPAQRKMVDDRAYREDELRGNQTILFVDDEDLLLTMGQMILSAFGYRVITANSGNKALEILSRPDGAVQLVITDLVMPGMSGRELIDQLRIVLPDVRIICTSGYLRPGQAQEEEMYLQKPFTSQELLRKVREALA